MGQNEYGGVKQVTNNFILYAKNEVTHGEKTHIFKEGDNAPVQDQCCMVHFPPITTLLQKICNVNCQAM